MSKEMVISANPHETRVAILEEGQLCEYYVEREKEFALVGSIYKGRVTRVLPGMQSAFVDIGLDSDAFLYVSDFLEGIEEFEPIVTTVEDKVQKMEEQGGQVFAAADAAAPAMEPADVEPAPAAEAQPADLNSMPAPETSAHAIAPPVSQPHPPARSPYGSDRPRFDRGRDRRDFGRGGGGGGRGRGRHGGRRGGHGGDRDRRYGRELPPSKFAAPRSYDERPGESVPSDYVPIILPGESLAKYRDRAPSAAAPAPAEESLVAAPPIAPQEEPHIEPVPPRAEFHAPASMRLEPLPGETLSKYQPNEPAAAVNPLEAEEQAALAAPHIEEPHPAAPDVHDTADLSEDQAATLAAHVTEAQNEEVEAEHEADAFASAENGIDEDSAEPEISAMEHEDDLEDDHDLIDEEAQAEAEGMIAPSEAEESPEHERIAAEGLDAIQAAAEAAGPEPGNVAPRPPQENQPWKARVRGDFRSRMQHPSRRGGRDRGRRDDRDRGRRPHHGYGHGHRPQPRRPQLISDMLKQGQEIIVQIAKEPLGKKGARITSHVALPGRFLVYMPTLDHTGVSRKIASAEDRARLRHLVNEAKGSAGGGFIVRTAAGSASPDEVRADVEFLTRTWSEIKARSEQRKAPSLLHRDLNLVERILRDYVSNDFGAIWVDTEEEFTKVVDFMSRFQPELVNRVKLYTKDTPVFEEFGIQQEIDKGLRPKVWLKSGGYIVINHTEALVAIDVNTGKFVGKGSTRLEDTIVRTNLEAVKEIVRQMRLRDLGGIIIIDFIDMEERRNREKVMAALEDALRADRAPSKVLRFNEFGLVAITRKRTKQALERTLCQPCPYCTGSGMVKSIPTLCYEIQAEARKMAPDMDSGSLTLRVHPEIAKALKTRESSLIEELERWAKKSVIIQADPTLHWEQYDIY
ncbi:MAG TPA: Rne/Rng family ribonuclease [Candidatus Acidoferrum sp.]|nr:Rne/Rng family ribonuclease [Candidatus Acidoferrum sp.]